MSSLGERLRKVISEAGYNASSLAFELDWAQPRVSNYMNNRRNPSYADLEAINDVVKERIGDQLYFLVTGKEIPLADELESHIKKSDAYKNFREVMGALLDSKRMKLQPGTNIDDILTEFINLCSSSSVDQMESKASNS